MATSPIYGWAEPDNTDLVKNGALAIRTLGNAIDTTMGTMVAKTIIDAKGDLIAGSAADTALRLAVGSNGETLVADSSTSTGLRYQATQAAGKNYVINGGYDFWQRGTSFAAPSNLSYTTDRWWVWSGSSMAQKTISRQTGFSNNQYCARVARNSGQTETGAIGFGTVIESANLYALQGKTVTVSFYARAGVNYSASGGNLQVLVQTGTGVDQGVSGWWSGWTGSSTLSSGNVVLTTTATKYSVSFTVPSNVAEMLVAFQWTPTGTAGAADYFEATGVQLEIGSVATEFTRTGGSIQGELAAAQRYYYRNTVPTATDIGYALGRSSTQADIVLPLPVTMRTNPTAIEYGGGTFNLTDPGVGSTNLTGFTFVHASYQTVRFRGDAASGLTQAKVYEIGAPTSGYIGFSAEL